MSQARAEAVMHTYVNDVLGERRFELIPEFAAPDMVDHTQSGHLGPAALEAHARGFCDNIPDLNIDVVRIFATEDTAVGLWRWCQILGGASPSTRPTRRGVYPNARDGGPRRER